MTFREKLEKEHPDVNIEMAIVSNCPCDYGYERYMPRCPMDIEHSCFDCWEREIPKVDDATMEAVIEDLKNPIMTDIPEEIIDKFNSVGNQYPVASEDTCKILDSGNRRQFASGAVRDIQEGKGRCDLMALDVVCQYYRDVGLDIAFSIFELFEHFKTSGDPVHLLEILKYFCEDRWNKDCNTMFLEVSKHFEEGAKKYGENNWQKGIPVHCYIDSAVRHYLKFLRGDQDEPHDKAFCWNIMCAIWTCEHKPELNEYARSPDPKADVLEAKTQNLKDAMELERQRVLAEKAYDALVKERDIDAAIGYLGEALDG